MEEAKEMSEICHDRNRQRTPLKFKRDCAMDYTVHLFMLFFPFNIFLNGFKK